SSQNRAPGAGSRYPPAAPPAARRRSSAPDARGATQIARQEISVRLRTSCVAISACRWLVQRLNTFRGKMRGFEIGGEDDLRSEHIAAAFLLITRQPPFAEQPIRLVRRIALVHKTYR